MIIMIMIIIMINSNARLLGRPQLPREIVAVDQVLRPPRGLRPRPPQRARWAPGPPAPGPPRPGALGQSRRSSPSSGSGPIEVAPLRSTPWAPRRPHRVPGRLRPLGSEAYHYHYHYRYRYYYHVYYHYHYYHYYYYYHYCYYCYYSCYYYYYYYYYYYHYVRAAVGGAAAARRRRPCSRRRGGLEVRQYYKMLYYIN